MTTMATMATGFYLDATLLPVGRALAAVRSDVWYPGKPGSDVAGAEVADHEWIAIAAARDWAVIIRDKAIRSHAGARTAFADAGLRVFCLTGSSQDTRWQQLQLLVQRWDAMRAACRRPGPFLIAVTARGLRPIPPGGPA